MTLHILFASPWSPVFPRCLQALDAGDVLLLCGEGVNALREGTAPLAALLALPDAIGLRALDADCAQRGIAATSTRIERIDYAAFVALACAAPRSVSWY